ncbi:hypothetical protein GUITHDRAFT_117537 [Guillardia theta CCMP2712]|uniref:Uncharacterized protein n=1 Tax=Guillardia theta (strain CCMP2712) TaxID=905079 RepID=L1IJP4_GUITC|nr:hypothetical protein GUITHDRAFT_117537 [Guillardia theta CCMP2712]EKX36307.1 hypothetical protein GUITHDRAFT_117537 [Guillardia theta CCMP2712]|eukprot:XP_005823287.1 hypothetical protein GUITHDRAFT_117537 [Guillardia theta CCMP2712]
MARRSTNVNALAAFHNFVAKGDIEKVKDFVQGKDRKPGHVRIAVDMQDEDGLAAVHWAAMRGHKNVLRYLVGCSVHMMLEGGPEGNRADPTVQDKDGWSALTWAIFMVEQEPKMHGKEHASKKQLLEVINYLCQQAAVQEYIERSDRLLNKTAGEMADEISQQSDEAITAALKGRWDANKQYGAAKVKKEVQMVDEWREVQMLQKMLADTDD